MILKGLKMQCPNCGAEIVNNKCDYCDTKISNYHSKNTPSIRPNYSNFSNSLAINGGNATGNIGQVNKLYSYSNHRKRNWKT